MYRAMSPLLTKIEGLVVHTNTGKAPRLAPYYLYWEAKIYDGIKQVCLFVQCNHVHCVLQSRLYRCTINITRIYHIPKKEASILWQLRHFIHLQ